MIPFLNVIVVLAGAGPAVAQAPPDRPEPGPPPASKRSDDLSKRLLRKAMKQGDEDVMDAILRLMDESAKKVKVESNPGPQTQATQREIVEKLDEAIRAAAKNQRRVRRPMPSGSDKRRRLDDAGESEQRERPGRSVAEAGTEPGTPPPGASPEVDPKTGAFTDIRRGWGGLPPRERDELIQGRGEEYLERYRVWVERYYRALQESGTGQDR